MEAVLLLLVLLQIKHWYIDFVDQDDEEVKHKGIYLDWLGVKHSLKQGVGTFFMFAVWITFFGAQVYSYLPFIISLSLLDFIATPPPLLIYSKVRMFIVSFSEIRFEK